MIKKTTKELYEKSSIVKSGLHWILLLQVSTIIILVVGGLLKDSLKVTTIRFPLGFTNITLNYTLFGLFYFVLQVLALMAAYYYLKKQIALNNNQQ